MEQVGTLRSQFIKLDLPVDLLPESVHAVPVYFNGRLSRAFGRYCERSLAGFRVVAKVDLQPCLVKKPELYRLVVAHEAAHAVTGIAEGHGFRWKAWCLKLGGDGKARLEWEQVADIAKPRPAGKVVASCQRCQHELVKSRALRSDRIYTHRGCGGVFLPWR